MNDVDHTTPLDSHTLESLCKELVSGRGVTIDDKGQVFRISGTDARALLNWYQKNLAKWQGNVMKADVEILIDCLDKPIPALPVSNVASLTRKPRVVRVAKLRAHNFGGIHAYPESSISAPDFTVTFDPGMTLIEGANGSGKTSILSAMIWALTGYVFRSQRAPERIDELVPIGLVDDLESDAKHSISPITPFPPATVLKEPSFKEVQLDTWIEVAFSDNAGNEIGTVRRELKKGQRGKLEESCSNMNFLGLDPIALEVGTKMPGLIPFIRLGERSDIGSAVAALSYDRKWCMRMS